MRAYRNQRPQFVFSFHGELSHDSINLVGVADDDIVDWLKTLHTNGLLDRTILIMMSDHGNRFAQVRNTLQGKLEERLPFFSFTFPEAFKQKYADEYAQFKQNVDRLTTPFDVHQTLVDLIGKYIEFRLFDSTLIAFPFQFSHSGWHRVKVMGRNYGFVNNNRNQIITCHFAVQTNTKESFMCGCIHRATLVLMSQFEFPGHLIAGDYTGSRCHCRPNQFIHTRGAIV